MASVKGSVELPVIPVNQLSGHEMIGEGGFGIVFRSLHESLGLVAVKQLKTEFMKPVFQQKLKKEAQKLRSLVHPNIVHLHGVCMEPGNYGIVMEFVYHGSLDEFLAAYHPLDKFLKLNITHQILIGMSFLHSRQPPVIHQDLKSLNILITHKLLVKIADFGLSEWRTFSRTQTEQKKIRGTVTHIPPERWTNINSKPTTKFDVYSFGILLWEMLTEQVPYGHAPDSVIADCVRRGNRPDILLIPDETPEIQVNIMKLSWNQDPEARPNFEDMRQQFENLVVSKDSYVIQLQTAKASVLQQMQENNESNGSLLSKMASHCFDSSSENANQSKPEHRWYKDISGRLGVLNKWLNNIVEKKSQNSVCKPQSLNFLQNIQRKVRRTLDEPEVHNEVADMVQQMSTLDLESDHGEEDENNFENIMRDLEDVLQEISDHNSIPTPVEPTSNVSTKATTKVVGDAQQPEEASMQVDGPTSMMTQQVSGPESTESGVQKLMKKIGVEPFFPVPTDSSEEGSACGSHPEKPRPDHRGQGVKFGGTVPWTDEDKGKKGRKTSTTDTDSVPTEDHNGCTDPRQETGKPHPSKYFHGDKEVPESPPQKPPSPGKKQKPSSGARNPNANVNYVRAGPLPPGFMEGFNINFPGAGPGSGSGGQTVFNIANVDGIQIGDRNVMYVGKQSGARKQPKPPGSSSHQPKVKVEQLTKSTAAVEPKHMDYVAKHLGKDWRRLGRHMGFSEGQIDSIAADFHTDGLKEQIYQLLRKWYSREGKNATLAVLARHLWDIEKYQLAVNIK